MRILLVLILILNLYLNTQGIDWGLTSRWYADEKVANVLHMAAQRSLLDRYDYFYHPTGYQMVLLVYFVPYYLYQKLIGYPLAGLKKAASVSWSYMADLYPDFATGIYIYARFLSGILGMFTAYLLFLLGSQIYNKRAGLFSAALLSVCMGFVGVNHFAKFISLVNFLIVLVIYLCIVSVKRVDPRSQRKFFFLASFITGFAISIQYHSFLLWVPLFLVFSGFKVGFRERIGVLFFALCFCALGILLGTPSILAYPIRYLSVFGFLLRGNFAPGQAVTITLSDKAKGIFLGPANYFFELWSINGFAIFLFILIGLTLILWFWRRLTKKEIIVLSFIVVYYFAMTVMFEDKFPQTKHIIAIVPLLVLCAGKLLDDIFNRKTISLPIKYSLFLLVFVYSLAYTFKGNQVFVKDDTRYHSTRWIYENIPRGAKIEIFQQLALVGSDKILHDYEIIYLGRSSKGFTGRRFFKWDTVVGRDEYLKKLNKDDSIADYIILSFDNTDEINSQVFGLDYMKHLPGASAYIKALFENRTNFKIAKVIRPKNEMVFSHKVKGLVHLKNLFWDPVPSYDVTALTIYIFKNISKNYVP